MRKQKREISVTVNIFPEDDMYVAQCLEVPIASQGGSVEEAQHNLLEAFTLWLETASVNEIDKCLPQSAYNGKVVFTTHLKVPYYGQAASAIGR